MGSPFKVEWKQTLNLSDIKNTGEKMKALPFESALGCCDYTNVLWKDYSLHFKVRIGKDSFSCATTDVRKGKPTTTCKAGEG